MSRGEVVVQRLVRVLRLELEAREQDDQDEDEVNLPIRTNLFNEVQKKVILTKPFLNKSNFFLFNHK